MTASEAVVRLARQRSKDTSIISPADGVIVALPIALGQVLDTGAPAVRIAGRDDHLKVTAFVDEADDWPAAGGAGGAPERARFPRA